MPDWGAEFQRGHEEVMSPFRYPNRAIKTLVEVFDRLYCRRNQLFHRSVK